MRRMSVRMSGTGVCLLAGVLAGCVVDDEAAWRAAAARAMPRNVESGVSGARGVFDPVSLRVHPLTHVDARGNGEGSCVLVLHVELRDAFGDSVKGLGDLSVQLEGPGGEQVAWDVPGMRDPADNTRRFDPPTRTYRVSLRCPSWVSAWANQATLQRSPVVVRARLVRSVDDSLVGELAVE